MNACAFIACVLLFCAGACAEVVFPVGASGDGRYLVDGRGRAFFYHADTAWALVKRLTLSEAEAYFGDRKKRGFTAVHVHAISKEAGPVRNREGEEPFAPGDDILKPNEKYWAHLDRVVEAARERELLLCVSAIWIRWGGTDKEGWRGQLTDANARAYGEFLGKRYKRFDNVMWILGGDANPGEKTKAIHELARGIKAQAPRQLITVHNAPENASSAFFAEADWLDVNMAYTYREVQRHVLAEWKREGRKRPIVLGESGYEEESNDKRGGEPWRMRRQAYGAILSGALAGHAFGQKHLWRMDERWREAMDSAGSRQMAHVKALFAGRQWYALRPDVGHELVVEGFGKVGEVEYVSAARSEDGRLVIVYFPAGRAVTIDVRRIQGKVNGRWFDPTEGTYRKMGDMVVQEGKCRVTPPERNAAGEGDWVLVLEAAPEG